jgi:hypothetical protein
LTASTNATSFRSRGRDGAEFDGPWAGCSPYHLTASPAGRHSPRTG